MENESTVTSIILMPFNESEDERYLLFICFLIVYIVILFLNSVLFLTIYIERGLHEPMYFFICNLSVNGVYGSTVFLMSMLGHLLSQNYEISLTSCLLEIYGLYVYGIVEFTILALMSYDRYVAICNPLHYHTLMTPRKVFAAIALSWIIPCLFYALYFISTTVRLSFCGRQIEKLYCSNSNFQKLTCFDTSIEIWVLIIFCPGLPIVLILFSYAQILRICLFASKESQVKALQTCTPHLVTVVNYSVGVLIELINSSFNMSHVPFKVRIFLSTYFLVFPPLFNPVIYGITIKAIRFHIFKLFTCKEKVND